MKFAIGIIILIVIVGGISAQEDPPDEAPDNGESTPQGCTIYADCPPDMICVQQVCQDPCVGFCGSNAICKVDNQNHKPLCSCPDGYTGDPFTSCSAKEGADAPSSTVGGGTGEDATDSNSPDVADRKIRRRPDGVETAIDVGDLDLTKELKEQETTNEAK